MLQNVVVRSVCHYIRATWTLSSRRAVEKPLLTDHHKKNYITFSTTAAVTGRGEGGRGGNMADDKTGGEEERCVLHKFLFKIFKPVYAGILYSHTMSYMYYTIS